MGIAKDKRDYKYPYIENADEKLRDLCVKGLEARYKLLEHIFISISLHYPLIIYLIKLLLLSYFNHF